MLSVLIPTRNSAQDLEALFPVLVPAAVDGVVREVIAVDSGSTDRTLEICEDAGAEVLTRGLVAAAKAARADQLLILPPSMRLRRGWEEPVLAHLMRGGGRGVMAGEGTSWLDRLLGRGDLAVLAPQRVVAALPPVRDLAELRRRIGRRLPRI